MDRELVVRAQNGDHDAFASIARASIGRLTALARLILRNEDLAQDAVQDALVGAWRGIGRLRDPDRLDAWLNKVLVRTCREHSRRGRRREVREIALELSAEPAATQGQAQVDSRDQLERALQRLSVDQRTVLVLTYYVDLPLADAAEALGIPTGTLKSRLNRALTALRAAVEADERVANVALERFA